jgi:hypothetical protein
MVEDIMQKYGEAGYDGDCDGVIDGTSLLLDTLLISLTGRQPIFHASLQPHGQSGRQDANQNGELGRQGEAAPVQGAVCRSMMLGILSGPPSRIDSQSSALLLNHMGI